MLLSPPRAVDIFAKVSPAFLPQRAVAAGSGKQGADKAVSLIADIFGFFAAAAVAEADIAAPIGKSAGGRLI